MKQWSWLDHYAWPAGKSKLKRKAAHEQEGAYEAFNPMSW